MAKKKKLSPLMVGGILVGTFFLINKIAEAKAKGAAPALLRSMVSSKTVIPPNKRWRVWLKNGTQVEMSSALLQNAIESKAVKTYSLIPETV